MCLSRLSGITRGLRVALAILGIAAAAPAAADPAKEAPWLPEAAAYRLTLFLGNLAPVPWEALEAAWTAPHRGSDFPAGAAERLEARSELTAGQVLEAIAARDRDALFAASTRLVAARIEEELDRAVVAASPAEASRAISEARELYRAFADHVAAADPEAARRIGLAWLELSSSAGTAGVLGAGARPAETGRMDAARASITEYLDANYLIDVFAPRQTLTAIPETVAAAGVSVAVPPTLPPGSDIFDQDPLPRLVLNFEQQGIDEADLPLIAYGDMLFDSPQVFGSPARDLGIACSTCHNRSEVNNRLFIPGASHQPGAIDVDGSFFNPMFNDHRDDPIDTPSLRGLRFTGPYGRDGRFASLRDFARNVIVNEFAGPEPTPFMLDALVAYMTEFDFLPNSQIDPQGRLTDEAPVAARRGEAIFNRPFAGLGDRSCASCHDPSANFLDRKAHDIGSARASYRNARDGAFDTPTLLGTAFTAPYFHDGALPTLASVVDWFDESAGLGLLESERADLTAYLEAVGGADDPSETFDEQATPFRLAYDELTTFASTIGTLLPARDATHILLLIDTVAADLAADAGRMGNLEARPEIYALAGHLADVGTAVRGGDWQAATAAWATFRAHQAEIDARVY